MAPSRVVTHKAAEPKMFKPTLYQRIKFTVAQKKNEFVNKNKTKLKEQGERSLDNINFALTNQAIYALWALGGVAIGIGAMNGSVRSAVSSLISGDASQMADMMRNVGGRAMSMMRR